MLSRLGAAGLGECLDQLERLCMQLFWERQGAIDITIVSDHGHNLVPSVNFPVEEKLEAAGFRVGKTIADRERGVVLDINGLVTWFGVHTSRPAQVADALLVEPEIELATYLEGESVVVRDAVGLARIDQRDGRLRYQRVAGDPLRLEPALAALAAGGLLDADGFGSDGDWLRATLDAEFPDALDRLWRAFHGQVVSPPQAMFTLRDGHCAGLASMESWITMQSTHGGLARSNSDAVLLSTRPMDPGPLRSRDVLSAVDPRLARRLVR
jgi:hypothetical protein